MKKTFHYRIYPTKKQQTTLNRWFALRCETYHAALQERRDPYRMAGVAVGFAQQCAELAEVNAQVLQNVVKRVDLAFQAFFGDMPPVSASAIPAIVPGPAMIAGQA